MGGRKKANGSGLWQLHLAWQSQATHACPAFDHIHCHPTSCAPPSQHAHFFCPRCCAACAGERPVRGLSTPLRVPEHCPLEVADLQARCVARDPAARPSAAEIVQLLRALRTASGGSSPFSSAGAAPQGDSAAPAGIAAFSQQQQPSSAAAAASARAAGAGLQWASGSAADALPGAPPAAEPQKERRSRLGSPSPFAQGRAPPGVASLFPAAAPDSQQQQAASEAAATPVAQPGAAPLEPQQRPQQPGSNGSCAAGVRRVRGGSPSPFAQGRAPSEVAGMLQGKPPGGGSGGGGGAGQHGGGSA